MVTAQQRRRGKPPGSPSGNLDPNAAYENALCIRDYWNEKAAWASKAYDFLYSNLLSVTQHNQAGMVEATSAPPESDLDDLRKLKKEMLRCRWFLKEANESLEEAVPEWKRRKERQQESNIKANREYEEKLREVDEHIEEHIDELSTHIKEQGIKVPPIKEQGIKEQAIKEPDDGKDNFWEDDVEPDPPKKKQSVRKHKN